MDDLYKISSDRRWRERLEEVPWLAFPPSWQVKITPPFGSVDARFQVKKGDAHVSVYLDLYANAGDYGPIDSPKPYWEIYPHEGDVFRCALDDTESLMGAIGESLKEQLDPTPPEQLSEDH